MMNLMLKVALFLRDELSHSYELIPSDLVILQMLASHIGEREYWYISREEISKECRLKVRQFVYRTKQLEKMGLIKIIRTGKANGYAITLPQIPTKNYTPEVHSSALHEEVENNTEVQCSAPQENQEVEVEVHSSAPQKCNVVHFRSAVECTHKETINKQETNKEKRSTSHHTFYDFEFNDYEQKIAIATNVSLPLIFEKFINHLKQKNRKRFKRAEFDNWLLNERQVAAHYTQH